MTGASCLATPRPSPPSSIDSYITPTCSNAALEAGAPRSTPTCAPRRPRSRTLCVSVAGPKWRVLKCRLMVGFEVSTEVDLQNGQGQFSGNGGVIISASEPATTATQREGLHATSKRARSLSGPSPWVSEDFPLSSDVRLGWLQTRRQLPGIAQVEETVG